MADMTYSSKFISQGKKETVSARNLYNSYIIKNTSDDHYYRSAFYDFFLDHRHELEEYLVVYSVPQQMFYKPKLLSLQLYDTPDLWLPILRANGMKSVSDFHMPIIQVYEPSSMLEIIKTYFKREKKK